MEERDRLEQREGETKEGGTSESITQGAQNQVDWRKHCSGFQLIGDKDDARGLTPSVYCGLLLIGEREDLKAHGLVNSSSIIYLLLIKYGIFSLNGIWILKC